MQGPRLHNLHAIDVNYECQAFHLFVRTRSKPLVNLCASNRLDHVGLLDCCSVHLQEAVVLLDARREVIYH